MRVPQLRQVAADSLMGHEPRIFFSANKLRVW
jgi:hypothetical protein